MLTLRTLESYDSGTGGWTMVSNAACQVNITIDNTTQDLPPAPVSVTAKNITDTSVTLTWTQAAIADF